VQGWNAERADNRLSRQPAWGAPSRGAQAFVRQAGLQTCRRRCPHFPGEAFGAALRAEGLAVGAVGRESAEHRVRRGRERRERRAHRLRRHVRERRCRSCLGRERLAGGARGRAGSRWIGAARRARPYLDDRGSDPAHLADGHMDGEDPTSDTSLVKNEMQVCGSNHAIQVGCASEIQALLEIKFCTRDRAAWRDTQLPSKPFPPLSPHSCSFRHAASEKRARKFPASADSTARCAPRRPRLRGRH
jgi:hypothetical protein